MNVCEESLPLLSLSQHGSEVGAAESDQRSQRLPLGRDARVQGVKCAGHSGEGTVRQIRNEFHKETTDARNSVHVSHARQAQPTQNYTVFVSTF